MIVPYFTVFYMLVASTCAVPISLEPLSLKLHSSFDVFSSTRKEVSSNISVGREFTCNTPKTFTILTHRRCAGIVFIIGLISEYCLSVKRPQFLTYLEWIGSIGDTFRLNIETSRAGVFFR